MNPNLIPSWENGLQSYPQVRDNGQDMTSVTEQRQLPSPSPQCRLPGLHAQGQGCNCGAAGNMDFITKYNDMSLSHLQATTSRPTHLLPADDGPASWWPQRQSLPAYPQSQYPPFSTSDHLSLHTSGFHTVPGTQLEFAAGTSPSGPVASGVTGFGASVNNSDPYSLSSPFSMGEASLTSFHHDVKSGTAIRHSSDSDRSVSDGTTTPPSPDGLNNPSRADYLPHRGVTEKQMNFPDMKTIHDLKSKGGDTVVPEIQAQMDKNLMWVDGRWTCYRRNYITINVSYWLNPSVTGVPLTVDVKDGRGEKMVKALGVSLSATMDEAAGKHIGLVQHTAKRDRGPQTPVGVHKLAPASPGCQMSQFHNPCPTNGPFLPYQASNENNNSPPLMGQHTFERIQFKQATANNGRRRAQQQYYHIMVELHADIRDRPNEKEHWVKIAHKVSEAMVVRGRSPGHYKDSPSSSGQSSGNGGGSGGYRYPYSSHATFSAYGALTSSQSRNGGFGGVTGSYRSSQCPSGAQSSLVTNPHQNLTSPIKKFHDNPTLPLLVDSDTYSPMNAGDPYRYYSSMGHESGLRSHPHPGMKTEISRSPNPMIGGSCGSEEPAFGPIPSSPWAMTTCNRIPIEGKTGYDTSPTF